MGILPARERWLDTTESLLKGQHCHLLWTLAEGQQSGQEMHEQSLGLESLWTDLKEQPPEFLYSIITHTAEAIFLRQNTPFQVASA